MGWPTEDVDLTTTLSGENQSDDWIAVESGATQRSVVLAGKNDQLIGLIGEVGHYLKRIKAVVTTSANSQVVIKDGTPTAAITSATHASTACTTTVINTATITAALATNQYAGYILRIAGQARRIVSHPSTAGNAVAALTLDHALSAIPGTAITFTIDDFSNVYELLPAGMAVGTYEILIEERATGPGWRITTDSGVSVIATGKFS